MPSQPVVPSTLSPLPLPLPGELGRPAQLQRARAVEDNRGPHPPLLGVRVLLDCLGSLGGLSLGVVWVERQEKEEEVV